MTCRHWSFNKLFVSHSHFDSLSCLAELVQNLLDPSTTESPIKSPLFVCLAVSLLVFSRRVISFLFFFVQWQIIRIFKNWQNPFFQENSFLPKFVKKDPKLHQNRLFFFEFLKNFVISFSWKWSNFIFGKILVLKLWTEMLLASQIAGFFKM